MASLKGIIHFFASTGNRTLRLRYSRSRLKSHAQIYFLPVAQTSLNAPGIIGERADLTAAAGKRVVMFGPTLRRRPKSRANLYSLNSRNRHHSLRQQSAKLLKHWLSSEEAVRDYLDVAIYLRKFGRELNRAKLDADLESSGALEFVKNVERLVAYWFDGAPGSPTLDDMTRYAFRRLPINRTSKTDRSEKYAAQLAAGATGPSGAGSRRARYVVENLFPRRAACEIDRRTAETPRALRPFYKLALWAKFWFKRVFRVQFFVNALAFARAGSAKTDATAEFQRRVGIAPEKFNAQDWTAED